MYTMKQQPCSSFLLPVGVLLVLGGIVGCAPGGNTGERPPAPSAVQDLSPTPDIGQAEPDSEVPAEQPAEGFEIGAATGDTDSGGVAGEPHRSWRLLRELPLPESTASEATVQWHIPADSRNEFAQVDGPHGVGGAVKISRTNPATYYICQFTTPVSDLVAEDVNALILGAYVRRVSGEGAARLRLGYRNEKDYPVSMSANVDSADWTFIFAVVERAGKKSILNGSLDILSEGAVFEFADLCIYGK